MTTAYPLTWPDHIPRSRSREKGRFSASLNTALGNVRVSLKLFARDSAKPLADVIISSNVTLGAERPADPGVAVWFTWDGLQVCIPVDRYQSVAANLQAIHHVIEARRVELRHGTLALVRASFAGFTALPPPRREVWTSILKLPPSATREEIEAAYKREARRAHPDAGGSNEQMASINRAREEALRQVSSK